jgi:lipopolysaccharide transport system ATP-binding protein
MSDAVIRVEHLSKRYRLDQIGGATLREDLHRWWARRRGRPDPLAQIGQPDHGNALGDDLWALRDVSFEVRAGEILGIIGRNGAGKSTLPKILSRITAPTRGTVKIRGRVGSLLEIGTGFHPELSGRENIRLNGAILCMKRMEIDRRLDEIIDFSEIEAFIDTPVKRYSSGMYVRLAFAVAAHLEPEILIVDEVLAVGDIGFQQKCIGKLDNIAHGEGRTVLFVSHNLGLITQLCSAGMLLHAGTMIFDGAVEGCVEQYLGTVQTGTADISLQRDTTVGKRLVIQRVRVIADPGLQGDILDNSSPAHVEVTFDVIVSGSSHAISIELARMDKGDILTSSTLDGRPHIELGTYRQPGRYTARLAGGYK